MGVRGLLHDHSDPMVEIGGKQKRQKTHNLSSLPDSFWVKWISKPGCPGVWCRVDCSEYELIPKSRFGPLRRCKIVYDDDSYEHVFWDGTLLHDAQLETIMAYAFSDPKHQPDSVTWNMLDSALGVNTN
mmetsp:Transcript_3745/g.6540  ORF Transcript_3745/g.6540 Transcript_3745/m.6540 type:complete len:129 (-) Transcript_3745:244-630(-)